MNLGWGTQSLCTGSEIGYILIKIGRSSHSTHSYFGPVRNRIQGVKDDVSAGGSSGGSALAVALGECDA